MIARRCFIGFATLLPAAVFLLAFWPSRASAQTKPTITLQPVSQTAAVGNIVTLDVVASGTGPFTCQWKRSGVDLFYTVIANVAGDGSLDYTGDGGAAANAGLTAPYGVSLDSSGNLFIADAGNSRIRKVAGNGTITTVAGNGSEGYSGDGGAATNASLFSPTGVAVDGFGNIFISDTYNNRIRKVTANGMITTVAGVGPPGDGDGGYSGDGGMAANASLQEPMGLALDLSGNLFIADTGNSRIRKVAVNGTITTVAGDGSIGYSGDGGLATNARLRFPYGVAVDASGNLFFADLGNSRIRKINTNGMITTVAGNGASAYSGDGGAATNASLNFPYGVAVDTSGDLFIADSSNNRIREVDVNGIITTVAGNGASAYSGDGGAATQASVDSPFGVAVDAYSNLFVADTLDSRVREVYSAGRPTLSLGEVSLADGGDYEVIITSPYGSVTSAVATVTVGVPPSVVGQSVNVAVAPGGTAMFHVEAEGTPPFFYSWYFHDTNLVQRDTNSTLILANATYTDAGQYSVVITNLFGSATSGVAALSVFPPPTITTEPASQTTGPGSNVTLSVAASGQGPFSYQWQFNGGDLPNGLITTIAGNGASGDSGDGGPATKASLRNPTSVAMDVFGNLFIADSGNEVIRKVDVTGAVTAVAGGSGAYPGDGGPAIGASLNYPTGVAVDVLGNLYIADLGDARIRKVDINGIIATAAGNGLAGYSGDDGPATNASLNNPYGVAVDALGNLFIADFSNARIRRVNINGIISTVAGNGSSTFSGDGGAATNASLDSPTSVAVDASGNLFIADLGNARIRKVTTNGIISTVAGDGASGYSGDGGAGKNASLDSPTGVAVDASGIIFIADTGNNVIREVDTEGVITTVAGNGRSGDSVDGGSAIEASLNAPTGLAVDAFGSLVIADFSNNRIRQVHFGGFPTLSLVDVSAANAGNYQVVITSAYGSVTSAVVAVTVTLAPLNATLIADGNIFLAFNGAPGSSYVLQTAANLTPPINWQTAFTNVADTNGNWSHADSNTLNSPVRFYRIILP